MMVHTVWLFPPAPDRVSLSSPGWPPTQRSACLCLLRAGINDVSLYCPSTCMAVLKAAELGKTK